MRLALACGVYKNSKPQVWGFIVWREVMIYPVILCGGNGTRLWPLSRTLYPKQFMQLGGHTLFGDTLERCRALPMLAEALVICNEEHRFYVAAALQEQAMQGRIVLEPQGRNTAPAIALAALQALAAQKKGEEPPVLLVLPSDHSLRPVSVFADAVQAALPAVQAGALLTFGISPCEPSTGFGYIVRGAELVHGVCYAVDRFQEKPDAATAQTLIDAGNCYWNSGMFLFRADSYLAALRQYAPAIYNAVHAAWEERQCDLDFIRPAAKHFLACPADSIDYAVMEHTDKAAVVPLQLEWNDLGSWEAFYQNHAKDADGNACVGDVLVHDSHNCYVHSTRRLVATLGLENIAVIETADAVLVAQRDAVQQVKSIVARLKADNRAEFELHPKVYRPWGSYEGLACGARFQVKRIVVNPGAALSLQKHHHRAEHWVVVGGTAEVRVGEETRLLTENESVYIPLGAVHRLKNPGKLPLTIVEIQSGAYLGEDDIVRIEDEYGRLPSKV